MTRRIVGPFNRVEGDLEVTLDIEAGRVEAAYVNSPLFRGFEDILQGKVPLDALVFVPRICGICSVAQSAAVARALADAFGWIPPANGMLAARLTVACENLADHLTHFYLYFMPDFARDGYRGRPWFEATQARFKAVTGTAAAEALAARAGFLHAMGLLAGKWPHTLALQPGGSSRPLQGSEQLRLHRILREFRRFLESRLFGDTLESVAALDSPAALDTWAEQHGDSDFGRFLHIARDLGLDRLGRATDVFMSYGAYDGLFAAGVWAGGAEALDTADIREDVSHAWYAESIMPRHPREGTTVPMADKPVAYSWCKAPRLGGRVVEVGALARQVVAGQPLARALVAANGASVLARVAMRLLEIARVLPEMERWADALMPGEPYCTSGEMPEEAEGMGLVEAARGSLGHWLTIRRGRLQNYQIVAPTTWNFSPRDLTGRPGALEQALVGVPATELGDTLAVQHVVRSFDPCMVCTVH